MTIYSSKCDVCRIEVIDAGPPGPFAKNCLECGAVGALQPTRPADAEELEALQRAMDLQEEKVRELLEARTCDCVSCHFVRDIFAAVDLGRERSLFDNSSFDPEAARAAFEPSSSSPASEQNPLDSSCVRNDHKRSHS